MEELHAVLRRPRPENVKWDRGCALHTDNFSTQEKSSWNYGWSKISECQIFFKITKFRYQFQNQPTNNLAFFFANAGKVGMSNKAIFIPFSGKAPCLLDLQAT